MPKPKTVRAIIIDPVKREVREETIENSLDGIYKAGHYDCFCIGLNFRNRDALYVDDEGLFKDEQVFFKIEGQPQPLAGYGVILGTDEEGESVSAKSKLEEIKAKVQFQK